MLLNFYLLPLKKIKDQQLCILLMFDESCRQWEGASNFGAVLYQEDLKRHQTVLYLRRLLQPKYFSTAATRYGIENEPTAISEYVIYQQDNVHHDLTVSSSGFHISVPHPYSGASLDGAVYDPTNNRQPFGFLEVKWPYRSLYNPRILLCN